ncbi:neuronal acetylcholine receptor subunit alpha-4 [Plakobranchus ocellatus]|uniref:Neuronal acetylcholine receptor subunit alpha-4 n=1 Tax=Plakobranchus ocellatus TaxID=259542 RepID=A0AAV4AD70_9GAST|nr:neuronal acetylcholine receptor subunit alpha-4 [Plakobranchus ocellatus]
MDFYLHLYLLGMVILLSLRCCQADVDYWPPGVDGREGSINVTDETRLINAILHNYNPAARPVYNASHTVTVKFGVLLSVSASSDVAPPLVADNATRTNVPQSFNVTSGAANSHPGHSITSPAIARNQSQERVKIMSQGVGQVPDEQVLMEKLMIGYHRYSRPVVNASYTVTVKFGLTLVQISDMVSAVRSKQRVCHVKPYKILPWTRHYDPKR